LSPSVPRFCDSAASRPVYTDAEVGLMRLLAPHFCRAMSKRYGKIKVMLLPSNPAIGGAEGNKSMVGFSILLVAGN